MTSKIRLARTIAGLVLFGTASVQAAQPAPAQPVAPVTAAKPTTEQTPLQRAQHFYELGQQAFGAERYKDALQWFSKSLSEHESLGAWSRLAETYEHLSRWLTAQQTFAHVAALARKHGNLAYERHAQARWSSLNDKIPALRIQLPTQPPTGFEVALNGVALSRETLLAPLRLDPGRYEIKAQAPGHLPFSRRLTLSGGASVPTALRVPPLAAMTAPATAERVPPPLTVPPANPFAAQPSTPSQGGMSAPASPPQRTNELQASFPSELRLQDTPNNQERLPWIVGGAGAATLVASGLLFLVANSKYNGAECLTGTSRNRCSPEGVKDRNRAKSLAWVGATTGVLGALGVGAGFGLEFLVNPRGETGATLRMNVAF